MKIQAFRKDLVKLGIILLVPCLFGVALLAWLVSLDVREVGAEARVGVAGVPLLGREAEVTSGTAPRAEDGRISVRDKCLDAFSRLAAEATSETRRVDAAAQALAAMFADPAVHERARQVGQAFSQLVHGLDQYYRERQWARQNTAEVRLNRFLNDFNQANGEFERLLMEPAAMHALKSDAPEAVADGVLQTCRIKTAIEDSMLALLIYHEQWTKAADLARGLKRQDGWVFEKELLARLGPAGDRLIAARAAARNLKAIKRSVMSIGPDFQGPHHEPGD